MGASLSISTAPHIGGPSVGDLIAFDALPDDTRRLVERVYGAPPAAATGPFSLEDLRAAYESGHQHGEDSVEIHHNGMLRNAFEQWHAQYTRPAGT